MRRPAEARVPDGREAQGCAVVVLGPTSVIMSADAPRTAALLHQRGLTVVTTPVTEFERIEGCVTCVTTQQPEPTRPTPGARDRCLDWVRRSVTRRQGRVGEAALVNLHAGGKLGMQLDHPGGGAEDDGACRPSVATTTTDAPSAPSMRS